MKHQTERGGEPWRFLPHVYRRIRRASPIVMLVCMAASCWFVVRVVLLVDNFGGDQTFGADILVMAGIVAALIFVVVHHRQCFRKSELQHLTCSRLARCWP